MSVEIVTALGAIFIGFASYLFGYLTDRDKGRREKTDKIIERLEGQIETLQKRIYDLEDRIDTDRKRYQEQIDQLQSENVDLKVRLAEITAKCKGCVHQE